MLIHTESRCISTPRTVLEITISEPSNVDAAYSTTCPIPGTPCRPAKSPPSQLLPAVFNAFRTASGRQQAFDTKLGHVRQGTGLVAIAFLSARAHMLSIIHGFHTIQVSLLP
ncbi:hypothetical protein K461DRAFT_274985 [Myriangium duriaei CBS 260.36]|uniref:Uncharacterized protein n=1 Tax=Myriangium duriaei CBS 260.36 TaxID=1168546 RepID=A0A9P4J6T0_9PEZI|nr:hypothetical protein K461DRAFT_274985 [Myriangium duriaei CBS 260.36]